MSFHQHAPLFISTAGGATPQGCRTPSVQSVQPTAAQLSESPSSPILHRCKCCSVAALLLPS
eukprot:14228102-Alexandrium_andersonii.AAC.1